MVDAVEKSSVMVAVEIMNVIIMIIAGSEKERGFG